MSNSNKKLSIAVIQLTRIGDLIQTAQAVRQFRSENPETIITLIARRKFASNLTFLLETVFDKIIMFDTKELFPEPKLSSALETAHSLIDQINENNFDVTVNLSFSKSSSYLNTLIASPLKLGLARNNKSEINISDSWSQFVYSNVMNSTNTPFSLVDIYRYILGCKELSILNDENSASRKNIIVLHPFASSKKKRWGLNKWNELIFKISKLKSDHVFHIVGANSDHEDAKKILNSPALSSIKDRIFLETQDSNIIDTYKLLTTASLFIGHDSMVAHLASETLTPSVMISMGTVRPHETSAYSDKVINIAPRNKCYPCNISDNCDLLPCHSSINHQTVAAVANGLLEKQEITKEYLLRNLSEFHFDNTKIYKTYYSDYGLSLSEITSNTYTLADSFKEYYKVIWQYYLRAVEVKAFTPDITKSTAQDLVDYQKGLDYLSELYNFGMKYTNQIISELETKKTNNHKVQENINKLAEIDQLCAITKKSYPMLAGLIDFAYVKKANASGRSIEEICKSNLLTYYDLSNLVQIIKDFINNTTKSHIIPVVENTREI